MDAAPDVLGCGSQSAVVRALPLAVKYFLPAQARACHRDADPAQGVERAHPGESLLLFEWSYGRGRRSKVAPTQSVGTHGMDPLPRARRDAADGARAAPQRRDGQGRGGAGRGRAAARVRGDGAVRAGVPAGPPPEQELLPPRRDRAQPPPKRGAGHALPSRGPSAAAARGAQVEQRPHRHQARRQDIRLGPAPPRASGLRAPRRCGPGAPEVLRGQARASRAADDYSESFGVVLYEALSRRPPFGGADSDAVSVAVADGSMRLPVPRGSSVEAAALMKECLAFASDERAPAFRGGWPTLVGAASQPDDVAGSPALGACPPRRDPAAVPAPAKIFKLPLQPAASTSGGVSPMRSACSVLR